MFELQVADAVATVTMARAPVNAMNDAWVAGFHELLDGLETRDDWSVLRVRSGLKLFSGGADLKQYGANFDKSVDEQAAAGMGYQKLFSRIEGLPRVTLAEIKGPALGGGLELALACDLRIASEEAKLCLPEVKLGLMPGAGGTQRLPRLVGPAVALKMILSGEPVSGGEALGLGLVQWAVPLALFDERADAIVRQFAALPPHAAQAAKAAVRVAFDRSRDGYAVETDCVKQCLAHPRTRELVGAFLARSSSR
ncbi:MAG: enoyl-CoA hydratase/isomerase family protein [Ramlibacter sp.]